MTLREFRNYQIKMQLKTHKVESILFSIILILLIIAFVVCLISIYNIW